MANSKFEQSNEDPEKRGMGTMLLYVCPEQRVANELKARGLSGDAASPLDVATVATFDSLHYNGTDAVDDCAKALQLTPAERVLDVGSGLGGPARHLASTAGCRVTALELQDDYGRAATTLTERCGLASKVDHETGSILDPAAAPGSYDAVVSWLCFLHVQDKGELLGACAAKLAPGGALYVEDYYAAEPLTAGERASLAKDVAAPALPSRGAYEAALADAGFVDLEWTDMTATWSAYVADRAAAYEKKRDAVVAVHGAAVYDAQLSFFRAVDALFKGGRLGGVRYVARRAA
mmetsp:Transcript_30286/g.93706  ORF Transcript_30286/g.93706 Transcript_30286/m.93706 type:complete len:292 (-) Transcript_30286:152-1027(-)